jgi:hypothetical protein
MEETKMIVTKLKPKPKKKDYEMCAMCRFPRELTIKIFLERADTWGDIFHVCDSCVRDMLIMVNQRRVEQRAEARGEEG